MLAVSVANDPRFSIWSVNRVSFIYANLKIPQNGRKNTKICFTWESTRLCVNFGVHTPFAAPIVQGVIFDSRLSLADEVVSRISRGMQCSGTEQLWRQNTVIPFGDHRLRPHTEADLPGNQQGALSTVSVFPSEKVG